MTMAACFKCGVIKFGAFVPCPKCSGCPQTEDELALSLASNDGPLLRYAHAGADGGIRSRWQATALGPHRRAPSLLSKSEAAAW